MAQAQPNTFCKRERMVSRKLMETLFSGGQSRSAVVFPVRVVYMLTDRQQVGVPVQVLLSVSKRHFKRAVKRNRVKRQLREAYRKNKHALVEAVDGCQPDKSVALAFIWLADKLYDTAEVEQCVATLLKRIEERAL